MGYIEPKTNFKDGDILYGIDLNASNEVIKAGVDDNFDKIKELQNNKQNNLTAGEGIDITGNVISNTQTSAEWGNIIGTLTDQSDLLNALNDKQELLESGINIKTINNQSLLGEGNINISGTGGTSNYNDLENKPQINNITLAGNKTLEDLGIDIPTKISDLINDNDTVTDSNYVHTDSNYTSAEKIKLAGIESGAQVNIDEIVFDENEATEDTKLIIEPFDFQPSDVANEYSTDIHRAYSCDYVNKKFGSTTLYENANGYNLATNGIITLNDNLSNYKYIDIIVSTPSSAGASISVHRITGNQTRFDLSFGAGNYSLFGMSYIRATINNNIITGVLNGRYDFNVGGAFTYTNNVGNLIYKIVGHK